MVPLYRLLDANKMRSYARQFTLTKEGKLARGEALQWPRYGIYAFIFDGKVIRFGESKSGFERIKKGFNRQLKTKNKKRIIMPTIFVKNTLANVLKFGITLLRCRL